MISGRGASSMRGRVRAPRRIAPPAENQFDGSWGVLQDAFMAIHSKKSSKLSFEQLYRAAYKIVVAKEGARLYDRVTTFEEQWFTEHVMPAIVALLNKNFVSAYLSDATNNAVQRRSAGEAFLRGLKGAWVDHNEAMNMIADILMYLDRAYVHDAKKPSVFAKTIGLFRDHVLRSSLAPLGSGAQDQDELWVILNAVLFDHIKMERQGDMIDKGLVKQCVYILEALYETDEEKEMEKLYLTLFEPRYLEVTRLFYRDECERLLREGDASSWLRQTKKRLVEEEDRCKTTVSTLSMQNIMEVVDQELITRRLDEFLAMEGSGIKSMLDGDRFEDLSTLYQLVCRVDPNKLALKQHLVDRVVAMGNAIHENLKTIDFSVPQEAPAGADDGELSGKPQPASGATQQTLAAIRWVDDVLKLQGKFEKIVAECFDRDVLLQSTLTRGFSDFVNNFNRSAEFISLFIDHNLKRGIKGLTEAEVDLVLENAIILIRFVKDKDMLERYYQKHLARRLLASKSESDDAEQLMISRMKQEVGNDFTRKFEGMFKDMVLSAEINKHFAKHRDTIGDDSNKANIELTVNVLSTNRWPVEIYAKTDQQCIWPPEIQKLQSSFNNFYQKSSTGRILRWSAVAGTAELRCTFPKVPGKDTGPLSRERRYDVSMGSSAMIVLMMFNDLGADEAVSFKEIQAKTNIPEPELIRVLTALSVPPKCRLLAKDPATKSVDPSSDKFSFNAKFLSKTIKLKVPNITLMNKVEDKKEREDTEKKAETTRSYLIDAAIVRIMKQRKESAHQNLVSEVIQQVSSHFQPDITLIKKRIEDLIAREYLERKDRVKVPTYIYLA